MNRGFSLIEMLIVIAVVGILSAGAAAVYKKYMLRASLSSSYTLLQEFGRAIELAYQKGGGVAPATVQFYGITYSHNIQVCGFPGPFFQCLSYRAYSNGAYGIYSRFDQTKTDLPTAPILYQFYVGAYPTAGGYLKYHCGNSSINDPNSTPNEYLPSICTCNNMAQLFNGNDPTSIHCN